MSSVDSNYMFSNVLNEPETPLWLTCKVKDVDENKIRQPSSDMSMFYVDITNDNPTDNSVHANIYNPFRCLSDMAEQSLTGNFACLTSLPSNCYSSDNRRHSNSSTIQSRSSCSSTSGSSTKNTDCHGYSNCEQQNQSQTIFQNTFTSLSESMSFSSSSSPPQSPNDLMYRSTASTNFLESSSGPFYHRTTSPTNERRSRDFTTNSIEFNQSLPANCTAAVCNESLIRKENIPLCLSESLHQDNDQLPGWTLRCPENWSSSEVLDWVFSAAQERGVDMQDFRGESFQHLTGAELCRMSLEDFASVDPSSGAIIYHALRELLHQGVTSEISFKQEECSSLDNSDLDLSSYDFDPNDSPCVTSSQYEDPCQRDLQRPMTAPLIPTPCWFPEMTWSAQLSRRRPGRPRVNRALQNGRNNKDKKVKSQHLWEFIYAALMNPLYNPHYLRWENQREGVFRFVQSEAVARLWGGRKHNDHMTYEKLSRAMRHYYRRGILERVQGRRLVYKFSQKAMEKIEQQKNCL